MCAIDCHRTPAVKAAETAVLGDTANQFKWGSTRMKSSKYPEAAFLATMTASTTHEVRNVLAIVKESAGLIEDLLLHSKKRGEVDPEKVQRAVDRIEAQVKRGADLLTSLNRLSHTLDQEISTVDLNQEVDQVVFLSRRFARKRDHEVVASQRMKNCDAYLNPLLLQMVLFTAMECCFEELPENSTIAVGVRKGGDGNVVDYMIADGGVGFPSLTPQPELWEELKRLADALGATVERAEQEYGIRILFDHGTKG